MYDSFELISYKDTRSNKKFAMIKYIGKTCFINSKVLSFLA